MDDTYALSQSERARAMGHPRGCAPLNLPATYASQRCDRRYSASAGDTSRVELSRAIPARDCISAAPLEKHHVLFAPHPCKPECARMKIRNETVRFIRWVES